MTAEIVTVSLLNSLPVIIKTSTFLLWILMILWRWSSKGLESVGIVYDAFGKKVHTFSLLIYVLRICQLNYLFFVGRAISTDISEDLRIFLMPRRDLSFSHCCPLFHLTQLIGWSNVHLNWILLDWEKNLFEKKMVKGDALQWKEHLKKNAE